MSLDRAVLNLSLKRMAAASIEWFDLLLYGTAAALVFPTVFLLAAMPLSYQLCAILRGGFIPIIATTSFPDFPAPPGRSPRRWF